MRIYKKMVRKGLMGFLVMLLIIPTAFAYAQLPLRINSAGQAYTDTSGKLWLADQAYSSGS